MKYVIIERLGHLEGGLVPHDVEIDGVLVHLSIGYTEARDLVAGVVKSEDTVTERYESTGTEVTAVGKLPD